MGNYYIGEFGNKPVDKQIRNLSSSYYSSLVGNATDASLMLPSFFREEVVGDGAAFIRVINKEVIREFFNKMESDPNI